MKIAYNWLRDYLDISLAPEKVSELLTDCGLEVEGLEEVETVEGGLKGLVIGEVVSCEKHPNADKLYVTKVNVGEEALLPIVCGAPNVATGQKVVVATVNTVIHPINGESFEIKKAKIRGEVSQGMICAEDEIGLGASHDGIMVLPEHATVGMPAADFFKVESDWIFEIGLTPNRADAMSHFGVARDLLAVLKQKELVPMNQKLKTPEFNFQVDDESRTIPVEVEAEEACPRYCGITISDVTVKESPDWLKNRLRSLGLNPHNNVVDITNFILHDMGQPLHAFDADKIEGAKVVVKTLPQNTPFTTLDEAERKLHANDLMICNQNAGMCIAGVFGGISSGVTENTTNIFLESAYFNPVYIRKTAKRHGLNTDASFRFERGIDPNITMEALKRAASMIKELGGGKITSQPSDTHSTPFPNFEVNINLERINKLIGKDLTPNEIEDILKFLEIEIVQKNNSDWQLSVPPYRVDTTREADVIEDILRIYGYNEVEIPQKVNASLNFSAAFDPIKAKLTITKMLNGAGFFESMNNSLTSASEVLKTKRFYEDELVSVENPLSAELNILRPDLFVNALETTRFNLFRRQENLKLFEWGKGYLKAEPYNETQYLSLYATGATNAESWNNSPSRPVDIYYLKGLVEAVFKKFGIIDQPKFRLEELEDPSFVGGISFNWRKSNLAIVGRVKKDVCADFDVKADFFFAQFNLDNLFNVLQNMKASFAKLPKFPSVRRDLALLLDDGIKFHDLKSEAFRVETKLLKDVNLFDVYSGKNLPEGKKSYALSFLLQDEEATLVDKRVDKVMDKLVNLYKQQFGAELR